MHSLIVVTPKFDRVWPWAADHLHTLWKAQGPVEFIRVEPGDERAVEQIASKADGVNRLAALNSSFTLQSVASFTDLKEAVLLSSISKADQETVPAALEKAGVRVVKHKTCGFWGPSVAECALALTMCGLRRIPQHSQALIASKEAWHFAPKDGIGRPGAHGGQYSDDSRFTNGTVEGKRIRIVGAGNIGSRYARFVHAMGADVAAWDPFATEPCFHLAGSRQENHLERLIQDAEIFAPMVPLMESTKGLITADHINALPKGCLVVLITRAGIVDMAALRKRVLADELSLAADVFDVEPLPLDDPLLGRHNVVHTPHIAGRTKDANFKWASDLTELFDPVQS